MFPMPSPSSARRIGAGWRPRADLGSALLSQRDVEFGLPIPEEGWGLVTSVIDPSGVLRRIAEEVSSKLGEEISLLMCSYRG